MYKTISFSVGILLFLPPIVLAVPTQVIHSNIPNCDDLLVPPLVDELGIAPAFSAFSDELISATDIPTDLSACSIADDPDTPNALVSITNLSGNYWADLWYVADATGADSGTIISNNDGYVDDAAATFTSSQAFKIDTIGVNTPLVSESMLADGIFEPLEIWTFIIQDYLNFSNSPASLFDSVGVASFSGGPPPSSGSIIAVRVPEPASVALAALGCVALAAFRWRRAALTRRYCTTAACRAQAE